MPKKPERPHYLGRSKLPPFEVGTPVKIIGPCLWQNYAGVVESYDKDTTIHVIKIPGKYPAVFHGEAIRECLVLDI